MKNLLIILTLLLFATCSYGQASLERGLVAPGGEYMWYRAVVTNNIYSFTNDASTPVSLKAMTYTVPAGDEMQIDYTRIISVQHVVTNVVSTNHLDGVVTNAIPMRWSENTVWTNSFTSNSVAAGSVYYEAGEGIATLGSEGFTVSWTNALSPRYLTLIFTVE